jgi:hypothetical protein
LKEEDRKVLALPQALALEVISMVLQARETCTVPWVSTVREAQEVA